MEKLLAKDILIKYRSGTATEQEKALVESWSLQEMGGQFDLTDQELLQDLLEIRQRLGLYHAPVKTAKLWPGIAAAAAVILVITTGLLFYKSYDVPKLSATDVAKNEIAPGMNQATLTLDDGRKISLKDAASGTLAKETGASITKTKNGQIVYTTDLSSNLSNEIKYNTIATPNGGQWRLTLADGTNVWLNATSSLTYPSSFSGNERVVSLTGEAYFEVAKDKVHPFVVKTYKQEVKVLGTHFNINSYENEPYTKTTLLEGSVAVSEKENGNKLLLSPGEAAFNNGRSLKMQVVNTDADVSWKNGYFTFKKADLKTVMRQFSRWYNVEIEYEGKVPDVELTGDVYRNVNASQALKILSYFNVHYRMETHKIIIVN